MMRINMKINKKILSLALLIILSMNLSACQLARSDSEYKETENLCGTFITYYKEGEGSTFDDENKKYYATFGEELLDKDIEKYKFEDLEGYALFLHTEGEGEDKVVGVVGDDVFGNINLSVNVNTEDNSKDVITVEDTDELPEPDVNVTSEENKISGTIYVTREFKGIIQFNPIIKEGKKYYTIRDGNSVYIDGENEGVSSKSSSSNSKTNVNSKTKIEKFSYTVSIEPVDELKNIKIKEMSSNDTLIDIKEIVHKNNDYKFKISKNTAYIIVEENCIDKNGKEIIKRTIYDRDKINNDETNHLCNYANDDGLVVPKNLYIEK